MKDKHEHRFELRIKRIRADNPSYKGTTGDKAFIYNHCECGHERALDMGETHKMAVRYQELHGVR